jgi:hypothetical protein
VRRALETENHFYPVFCAGVEFLIDLGEPDDRARIEFWASYPEYNTKRRAARGLDQDNPAHHS